MRVVRIAAVVALLAAGGLYARAYHRRLPPAPAFGPGVVQPEPLSEKLAKDVEKLASFSQVESEAVGYGGSKSEVWIAARPILAEATLGQLVGLLQHRSPVVRGYVAPHLARGAAGPIAMTTLLAIMADEAPVNTLHGCVGGSSTVAGEAFGALRYNAKLDAEGYLLNDTYALSRAVAKDAARSVDLRASALDFLADTEDDTARGIALGWTQGHDATLVAHGVRALAKVGKVVDTPLLLKHASDPDEHTRAAIAIALGVEGRVDRDEARPALLALVKDAEVRVREHAIASYASDPKSDPAKLEEIVRGGDSREVNAVAHGLAQRHDEPGLVLLGKILATADPSDDDLHGVCGADDLHRRLARELLSAKSSRVRVRALECIGKTKDSEAAAAVRGHLSLAGTDIHERMGAANAVIALADRDAVPALVKLLEDDNPHGAIAAAKALAALGAKETLPAVEKAAASPKYADWAKRDLAGYVAELSKPR